MKTALNQFWVGLGCSLLSLACANNGAFPEISASGTVEATEVTLSNLVPGQLLEVIPREGDLVHLGDVVATIDHVSLDLELERAKAGVAAAQAQLKLFQRGPLRQEIRRGEEMVQQAKASLDNAKNNLRRAEELLVKRAVAQSNVDNLRSQVDVLQAQFNAAQESLSVLRAGTRSEQIAMAEANLEQADLMVRILEKKISDCTVKSPISSRVVARFVEPGELAGTGTPLVRLADLSRVWIQIFVSETEMGRVKLGGNVDVKVDSFPDRIFPGKVTFISPQEEFTPKNIQTKEERVRLVFGVKVEVENQDEALKLGMPADVILLGTSSQEK